MDFVAAARSLLGESAVVDDPAVLVAYRRDQAGLVPDGAPLAAVLPTTTDEVSALVSLAAEHGHAIVARGAGSGQAGEAIQAVVQAAAPALLEVLDATTLRAIERWKRMDLDPDAAALLLIQSDLAGEPGHDEIAAVEQACTRTGATMVATTTDPAEAELLLAARRFAYPALEQLSSTILDDVAVPRTRIAELIDRTQAIAVRHGVLIGTFGHAGDGNLHPTIVFDATDPAQQRAARAAFDDIVGAALALGGTVTGEHGVGLLKRDHLAEELGPVGLRLHRAIKSALDSAGHLNPGKIL